MGAERVDREMGTERLRRPGPGKGEVATVDDPGWGERMLRGLQEALGGAAAAEPAPARPRHGVCESFSPTPVYFM